MRLVFTLSLVLRREDELEVLLDATPDAAITVLDNDETCLELKKIRFNIIAILKVI